MGSVLSTMSKSLHAEADRDVGSLLSFDPVVLVRLLDAISRSSKASLPDPLGQNRCIKILNIEMSP